MNIVQSRCQTRASSPASLPIEPPLHGSSSRRRCWVHAGRRVMSRPSTVESTGNYELGGRVGIEVDMASPRYLRGLCPGTDLGPAAALATCRLRRPPGPGSLL